MSTVPGPDGRDGSILKEPVLTEQKYHHHRDTWHGPKVWTTLVKAFGPIDGQGLYLGNPAPPWYIAINGAQLTSDLSGRQYNIGARHCH